MGPLASPLICAAAFVLVALPSILATLGSKRQSASIMVVNTVVGLPALICGGILYSMYDGKAGLLALIAAGGILVVPLGVATLIWLALLAWAVYPNPATPPEPDRRVD